jgi:nicotinate-nucleotide adenylyltransferase
MADIKSSFKNCIFGGAFDPIHCGHLSLAEQAVTMLSIDRLIWVPTFHSPHKEPSRTPYNHRLKMVQLAVSGKKGYLVSDIESRLSQPSFTLNTVKSLRTYFGEEGEWYLLMGADNWTAFNSWYQWEILLKEVKILIYPRENHSVNDLPSGVIMMQARMLEVTSTEIRELLKKGLSVKDSQIMPQIKDYILKQGLYT